MYKTQKAFTMLELVFVIAVIGILSAIALPKFAASRTDAEIAKAKSVVSAVRLGISTARQKLILSGKFDPIETLTATSGDGDMIFNAINDDIAEPVLEYPIRSCAGANSHGCWSTNTDRTIYTYKMPILGSVNFILTNSKFICETPTDDNCRLLTE